MAAKFDDNLSKSTLELTREAFGWAHSDSDILITELEVLRKLEFNINIVVASDIIDRVNRTHSYIRRGTNCLETAYSDPKIIKRGPEYIAAIIVGG